MYKDKAYQRFHLKL